MRVSFMTDTGRTRSQNQDAVFATQEPIGALPNLFVIADGMGGHNAGDYASKKAIDLLTDYIANSGEQGAVSAIQQGITIANEAIFMEASRDAAKAGMGTTMVVATIDGDMLRVANVGDSRLYIMGDGALQQVTRDHSVIEEMVRKGEVSKEVAQHHPKRNLITRAVGAEEQVRVDFFDVDLRNVDVVLMCSDGLTNMLEDERIAEIITLDVSDHQKVTKLVEEANLAGGKDNITVLIIEAIMDEVRAC